jgi:hypothetical protein
MQHTGSPIDMLPLLTLDYRNHLNEISERPDVVISLQIAVWHDLAGSTDE